MSYWWEIVNDKRRGDDVTLRRMHDIHDMHVVWVKLGMRLPARLFAFVNSGLLVCLFLFPCSQVDIVLGGQFAYP